ncbi:MAG: hypothetical protein HGA45_30780, partial [Chloroflexales bacterium]|nr:hypothetical protein [Chloroflexales bacterium]
PARGLGVGEDLPAGVAREWAAWCLHPRYLAGFYGKTVQRTYYDEVRTPLLWLTFGDDPIATPRNVPAMQAFYRGAPIVSRVIRPSALGLRTIGHLGFFREQGRERLWPEVFAWLATVWAPTVLPAEPGSGETRDDRR